MSITHWFLAVDLDKKQTRASPIENVNRLTFLDMAQHILVELHINNPPPIFYGWIDSKTHQLIPMDAQLDLTDARYMIHLKSNARVRIECPLFLFGSFQPDKYRVVSDLQFYTHLTQSQMEQKTAERTTTQFESFSFTHDGSNSGDGDDTNNNNSGDDNNNTNSGDNNNNNNNNISPNRPLPPPPVLFNFY